MVEHSAHLDAVFHALSDPTRRAMLGHLAERECTIGELATPFSMSFAGASKHVRVLEHAGLLTRNDGLVVRTTDGDEFQIQIVKR